MGFFAEIKAKERYGLRLILEIARTYKSKKPSTLKKISQEEKISMKYLEQLVTPFKKAKWVQSIRGREGGYIMKKDPSKISLWDVIKLIDEDTFVIECLKDGKHCKKGKGNICISKNAWKKIQEALEKAMKEISLKDLMENK